MMCLDICFERDQFLRTKRFVRHFKWYAMIIILKEGIHGATLLNATMLNGNVAWNKQAV